MMSKKVFISGFLILTLAAIFIAMFGKTFAVQSDATTSSNSAEAYMKYKEFDFFEKLEDS